MRGITLAQSVNVLWPESEWRSTLAHVYIQRDRFGEALEEAQKANQVAIAADDFKLQRRALHLAGLAQVRSGAIDQAEQTAFELKDLIDKGRHRKAIKLFHHLRGEIELKKGNGPKAIEELEKAVSMAADQSDALFISSLARAYTFAGQPKKALEAYTRLQNLRDGIKGYGDLITRSCYRQGIILEELGRAGEAIRNLETFLSIWRDADPGLPEVEDAKKRMAGLTSH
jgi:tetratricopeptide (TPR) repeat protein